MELHEQKHSRGDEQKDGTVADSACEVCSDPVRRVALESLMAAIRGDDDQEVAEAVASFVDTLCR